jgi:putative aldouronate transport system substrate-binding protein
MRIYLLFFLLFLFGCYRVASIRETNPDTAAAPETIAAPAETAAPLAPEIYPSVSVGMDGLRSADDAVAEEIARLLGIKLLPVDVGEYETELLVAMEGSGTLPDVLRADITSAYFMDWVQRGALRDWPSDLPGDFPLIKEKLGNSGELAAVNRLYGDKDWFLPLQNKRTADSGRIYIRKDWLTQLGIKEPDNLVEYMDALTALKENGKPGLTVAGGVTYIISMFGADPESWILEDGEWVPAFYSRQMVRGLSYVRRMYDNGLLDRDFFATKANGAVLKFSDGYAGSLIRHGDGYWLSRVLGSFAQSNRVTRQQVWDRYIAILPPLAVPFIVETEAGEAETGEGDSQPPEPVFEWFRFWPCSVQTLGIVVPASVDDEKFERICRLLEFIASEESREMAYFGIQGETSLPDSMGRLRLFIDPVTARPVDITHRYPAAQALFLLGRCPVSGYDTDIPSELPPGVKRMISEAEDRYDAAAMDEGDGFLARFIHTPAKDALKMNLDYSAAFNDIVMGTEPVEDMFEAFRLACETLNIRKVIDEVNARIGG